MERIDVSLIAPAFTFVPLFAAKRRGFFEGRGVDCVYEFVGSGDAVTERLQAGRIQLAPNTPEGALADRAAGGSLVVIGGLTNRLPFRLIGLPRHVGLESLRGGTIGVSSMTEGTVHVIEAMLATLGLSRPDDYTLKVVGAHPRRWELLLDAAEWLYDDLDGGADVLVEETGVEGRLAELSMRDLVEGAVIPRDLEPSRAGLELVIRIMRDNGRLADGAPLAADAYLDLRYLKRAQA